MFNFIFPVDENTAVSLVDISPSTDILLNDTRNTLDIYLIGSWIGQHLSR